MTKLILRFIILHHHLNYIKLYEEMNHMLECDDRTSFMHPLLKTFSEVKWDKDFYIFKWCD